MCTHHASLRNIDANLQTDLCCTWSWMVGCNALNVAFDVAQVIPAGATAKFPIVFQAAHVQHSHQTVEYVVNGCHLFNFQVGRMQHTHMHRP